MGNFAQERFWGSFVVTGLDSESISSSILVKIMEMTALIQNILAAAQLFGSQDYYNKYLVGVFFRKISRHR